MQPEWDQTYGGVNVDRARALVQTVDGGYALAGQTYSSGAGNYDFWLIKTDTNGNIDRVSVVVGLAWVDAADGTITLYRESTDPFWNYVRIRILENCTTP